MSLNHLIDLRNLLGNAVVGRQSINLQGNGGTSTTAVSMTQSETIALARMLEDVSVTAFTGAAIYLTGTNLDYASRVLAADGFHAGALRLVSIQTSAQYRSPAYAFGNVNSGSQTAVNFTGVTTTGSKVIYALFNAVPPVAGNIVTGVGVPAGSAGVITSVVPNSGVLAIKGDATSGSSTLLNVTPTAGLSVGQAITGTGVAANTIITAISGGTLTLSVPASATNKAVALSVSARLACRLREAPHTHSARRSPAL